MKKTLVVCALLASIAGTANAMTSSTTNAYVATVLGSNAYTIQNGGTQLYFHPQPDTDGVWYTKDGTVLTTTYGGQTYNRDGMKTFALSDVAYGQRLDSLEFEFDYYTGADTTGYNMSTPSINVFITDGEGHYGILSTTSGGGLPNAISTTSEAGWNHYTADFTNLSNSQWCQLNEYNGGVSSNRPYWSEIQDWTIAGFYDYIQYPEGGFGAWDSTVWGNITNLGIEDTTMNQYGIAINWGDTVGGMYEDGNGEIGTAANRPYGQAGRMIKDYTISVGDTTYDVTFVPEPATIAILGLGAFCLIRKRR